MCVTLLHLSFSTCAERGDQGCGCVQRCTTVCGRKERWELRGKLNLSSRRGEAKVGWLFKSQPLTCVPIQGHCHRRPLLHTFNNGEMPTHRVHTSPSNTRGANVNRCSVYYPRIRWATASPKVSSCFFFFFFFREDILWSQLYYRFYVRADCNLNGDAVLVCR